MILFVANSSKLAAEFLILGVVIDEIPLKSIGPIIVTFDVFYQLVPFQNHVFGVGFHLESSIHLFKEIMSVFRADGRKHIQFFVIQVIYELFVNFL